MPLPGALIESEDESAEQTDASLELAQKVPFNGLKGAEIAAVAATLSSGRIALSSESDDESDDESDGESDDESEEHADTSLVLAQKVPFSGFKGAGVVFVVLTTGVSCIVDNLGECISLKLLFVIL